MSRCPKLRLNQTPESCGITDTPITCGARLRRSVENIRVDARLGKPRTKLGQALIEIDGDEAFAETYAVCHHVSAEDGRDVADSVMGLRYLDRFERRAGAWRIARRELRWEWIRSDALESLDPDWTLGVAGPEDAVFRS